MADAKTVSFRFQTRSFITELIEDEGLACQASQNILSYLSGALLAYRDEGVELSPTVLFCTNIDAALKSFPGAIKYTIGNGPLSGDTAKRVLKDCAPLTSGGWNVYIERSSDNNLNYGVFNYIQLPTTIPLHEAISLSSDVFCVLIRKTSSTAIDLRGSRGNSVTLIFSTVREETVAHNPILEFSADCCRNVLNFYQESGFERYFANLIEQAITRSHGTILACSEVTSLDDISELKDGILLDPPLNFLTAFMAYREIGSAEAILTLQSYEQLLYGFLQCDGVVLLNTQGCVTAYRVFYRPSAEAVQSTTNVVGGARRRAFEGTKTLIGKQLVSALFRSQDGLTLRFGSDK